MMVEMFQAATIKQELSHVLCNHFTFMIAVALYRSIGWMKSCGSRLVVFARGPTAAPRGEFLSLWWRGQQAAQWQRPVTKRKESFLLGGFHVEMFKLVCFAGGSLFPPDAF